MPRLTEGVQTYIVQRLAMYDTPSTIAAALKEEFGIVVTRQQVQTYDPERVGRKPAQRWIDLHRATRQAFLEETAKLPVAHRAVRVKELDALFRGAKKSGNRVLAAALLKQIAEEVGDAYTNTRMVSAAVATYDLSNATKDQLRRIAAGEDPASVLREPPSGMRAVHSAPASVATTWHAALPATSAAGLCPTSAPHEVS